MKGGKSTQTVIEIENPSFPNLMVQDDYQAIKMSSKIKYLQLNDNQLVLNNKTLRAIGGLKRMATSMQKSER